MLRPTKAQMSPWLHMAMAGVFLLGAEEKDFASLAEAESSADPSIHSSENQTSTHRHYRALRDSAAVPTIQLNKAKELDLTGADPLRICQQLTETFDGIVADDSTHSWTGFAANDSFNDNFPYWQRVPTDSRLHVACNDGFVANLCESGLLPEYCPLHVASLVVSRRFNIDDAYVSYIEPILTILHFSSADERHRNVLPLLAPKSSWIKIEYYWPGITAENSTHLLQEALDSDSSPNLSLGKNAKGEIIFAAASAAVGPSADLFVQAYAQPPRLQKVVNYLYALSDDATHVFRGLISYSPELPSASLFPTGQVCADTKGCLRMSQQVQGATHSLYGYSTFSDLLEDNQLSWDDQQERLLKRLNPFFAKSIRKLMQEASIERQKLAER